MSVSVILVAEPTPEELEPIRIHLDRHGYALHQVTTAREALDLFASQDIRACIVDISSPEIKGIEVCRVLRQEPGNRASIFALNQGDHSLRKAALANGADLVIEEPIVWTDLYNWLQAPRNKSGRPLAAGAMLGQSAEDTIGAASLLSHDLKSPISVIISSLEVLLAFQDDDGMSDPTQRLLRGALHAAYRQLNLVSTLVDLPRLELDCYDLQLSEIDLGYLVRNILEKEAYNLDIKGLQVRLRLPDSPLMVMADRDLLELSISALIDCVMKFTVRDDELCLCLDSEENQVVLRLTDTGRPIQPGFERDIMTLAPQWQHRQAGARTSVALGLPFTYKVARTHGGDFSAHSSEDGKQTTFTFSLPAL